MTLGELLRFAYQVLTGFARYLTKHMILAMKRATGQTAIVPRLTEEIELDDLNVQ